MWCPTFPPSHPHVDWLTNERERPPICALNGVMIRFNTSEILWFLNFGVWAWNCLFSTILGVFEAYFPQVAPPVILTHKRHLLARKYVIWAIKCMCQCRSLTCGEDLEKGKDGIKVTKVLHFTYLWRTAAKPICPKICMWRYVLDVITCAIFQNEILRGSKFPFSYWLLNGHYNSACDVS